MLIAALRFTAEPLVVSGLFMFMALCCLALYLKLRELLPLIFAVIAGSLAVGALFYIASMNGDHFNARQISNHDLPAEKLPAQIEEYSIGSGDIWILVGQLKCEMKLGFDRVLGHDPDGWKLRYRPVMDWTDNNKHYGLGYKEIAQLGEFCDNRPPQD